MDNRINEVLSDTEKDLLNQFSSNEAMRDAVKKVLLFELYQNGTLEKGKKGDAKTNFVLAFISNNEQLSDEEVGSKLRAAWQGIRIVETAFDNISTFKREHKPLIKVVNQGR